MTNLTFAELTALMSVNGLVINDRYFITDKNWTIIAISTSTYRIVVPIVTELTLSELNSLIAASELNEGLQYKVSDRGWLLLATGANTLSDIADKDFIISSGEELPAGVLPRKIYVDSGIRTDDISGEGEPISASVFSTEKYSPKTIFYYPQGALISITEAAGNVDGNEIVNFPTGLAGNSGIIPISLSTGLIPISTGVSISGTGNAAPGIRILCEFVRCIEP